MTAVAADRPHRALVCGGAGFIGSHVVEELVGRGWQVQVIDPCHPRTGGSHRNLETCSSRIHWIQEPLERVRDLPALVSDAHVVVDAVGFTHHREGLAEPVLDRDLNYSSHLTIIQALNVRPRPLIYLGSRGQYGRVSGLVEETQPQVPLDAQGVHKAAAESMVRIYSARARWPALALRIGNCFGPRQPIGDDPGVLGEFFKTILAGGHVEIYGTKSRRQHALYVKDLARVIADLASQQMNGFSALNVVGPLISIRDFVQLLVDTFGRGSYSFKPFPPEIAAIHAGDATLSESRLRELVGIEWTPLDAAVRETFNFFEERHV